MNNEELKHYGIKGQKWGRRRFQNEDGSLTPAGRERYGEDRYKDHGDGRIEIEKGAQLQRILLNEHSRTDLRDVTYASITKRDNNEYMNLLGTPGKSRVLKLTANTKLKSPSSDEAASTFFKILRDDPKLMKEYRDSTVIQDEDKFKKDMDSIIKGNMTKDSKQGRDLYEYYFNVNYLMVAEDYMPNAKKAFFNELKKKGYNMIRDDYDWYTSGGMSSAVVLLDASNTVNITTNQIVTKSMAKKASQYCAAYAKKGEEYARKYGIS